MNNRQNHNEVPPTLFSFLNNELSLPCLDYNSGFVRAFNALPSDVRLDVYIDNRLLAKELGYKQFSYYIPTPTLESHTIKVFYSSNPNIPVIDIQINITNANVETLCIVGDLQSPRILMVTGDPTQQVYRDKASIRYANLTHDDLIINVTFDSNTAFMPLASYQYNRYLVADPETYTLKFILASNPENNYQPTSTHTLNPTRIYTFFIIGNLDIYSRYPLEIVVSVDMTTVIKTCPPDMKRKNGPFI